MVQQARSVFVLGELLVSKKLNGRLGVNQCLHRLNNHSLYELYQSTYVAFLLTRRTNGEYSDIGVNLLGERGESRGECVSARNDRPAQLRNRSSVLSASCFM